MVQMHVIDAESLEKPLRKKQTARQASKAHKQPTTRSSRSASFAAIESEQNVSEDGSSGGSTVDTEPYTTMAYAPIDELSSTSKPTFGPVQVYEVVEDGADDEYEDGEDTRSPTSISQFMGLDVSYDSENSLDGVLHCGEVAVEIPGVEDVMGFGVYDTEGGHSSKRRKTTHPPASDFKLVSMHDSTLDDSALDEPDEFDFEDQVPVVGLPIDATFIDGDMFPF
jgi:hypothetical protein